MTWLKMDAGALEFPDGKFDAVLEKGLFDALFAGTGRQAQGVLAEVERVLRPGGRFLSVSFAADRMQRLFRREEQGERAPDAPSGEEGAEAEAGSARPRRPAAR